MNVWSNIECSSDDLEIAAINDFETSLGQIPNNVKDVRELIRRFEGCHFKYRRHLTLIKSSIRDLKPHIEPSVIGKKHLYNDNDDEQSDSTEKNSIGWQYLDALHRWLGSSQPGFNKIHANPNLYRQIHAWLGEKNPHKIRLARLMIARLTWDWKRCEALQEGDALKDLELQTIRMDICHHSFPKNLNLVLQAIGKLEPIEPNNFEGCGTYNDAIRAHLKQEFSELNDWLKTLGASKTSKPEPLMRQWLILSLAKTIKETVRLSETIATLNR